MKITSNDFKDNLNFYMDKAINGECITITNLNTSNAVLLSESEYNQLAKQEKNAEYLTMIDKGIEQLEAGKGQRHKLIENIT